MEIKSTILRWKRLVPFCILLVVLSAPLDGLAQPFTKKYSIRDGKMCIALSKNIPVLSLDSFINKYELQELDLKDFLKPNGADSLRKMGWNIEVNSQTDFVICKPLAAAETVNNPADKIIFTEKKLPVADLFPATNNGIRYGYNRFRNKTFALTGDSIVLVFLRGQTNARKVMLAGSFNNWDPDALAMKKTDSGWIARLKLGVGKYWYKFVIDGNWNIDNDNILRENDGRGNINSFFFKPNALFMLSGFPNAKRVYLSGSFNNWNPRDIQMEKTATGWQVPLYLANGTHTYRYVIDGNWYFDESSPNRLPNEFGSFNSVVQIGKPHLFKLAGFPNAKTVILSGTFNGWRNNELLMRKTATGWELPYVLGPGNYEYRFIVDGKNTADPSNSLTVNGKNGNSYLIIDPNYTFRLKGFANAKHVYLAGDINNWNATAFEMKREGDDWVFTVNLNYGKHRYKYVVDGKWILDPGNKLWEQNEERTGNSIIWLAP